MGLQATTKYFARTPIFFPSLSLFMYAKVTIIRSITETRTSSSYFYGGVLDPQEVRGQDSRRRVV
jgi:hypothetical protein